MIVRTMSRITTHHYNILLDTCDHGHTFSYISSHPVRCPYCLANGLDFERRARAEHAAMLVNAHENRDWYRVLQIVNEMEHPHAPSP